MDGHEIEIRVSNMSNHIDILDYELKLSDSDISWLSQDFDYCYDDYFDHKKEVHQ